MIIPGITVVIPRKTQVIPGITQQKQGFLLQKQGFLLQKQQHRQGQAKNCKLYRLAHRSGISCRKKSFYSENKINKAEGGEIRPPRSLSAGNRKSTDTKTEAPQNTNISKNETFGNIPPIIRTAFTAEYRTGKQLFTPTTILYGVQYRCKCRLFIKQLLTYRNFIKQTIRIFADFFYFLSDKILIKNATEIQKKLKI